MKLRPRVTILFILLFVLNGLSQTAFAQSRASAPKDVLGFTPGDDYKLAHWSKIVEYFRKLDAANDRVIFREIGKTTMGKPFVYAVISSPKNLRRLDYYIGINNKLADPRLIGRSDKQARKLIKKGKTFVLITHGIHSTEVGSTLSSTLIAHRLATSNEKDIKKILRETIVVMVPSLNPDGVDIVKDWYDKTLGTDFEGTSPPELYHKYVGHDNNRDWYAFTQVETQMTVEKVHNVFHPQIVHDIHQQGRVAARFFVPPYEPPVEPNVPKEIIEGYTEIGNYIASEMRKAGFAGITNNTTYDAWTPARAYSHYHGGARILSETASARLASPVEIKFDDLRGRRGFDAKVESKNFGPVWNGGKWTIGDITRYMTTGAFFLMKHAAENRKEWLSRFYKIGKDATRPRKDGELSGFLVRGDGANTNTLLRVLARGGVEVTPRGRDHLVSLDQPYGDFAKALLERQTYPDLVDEEGAPIPPYDVTAHTLTLLMGAEVVPLYAGKSRNEGSERDGTDPGFAYGKWYGLYRSAIPSMDEGWTRWIAESNRVRLASVRNANIISGDLFSASSGSDRTERPRSKLAAIVFPDQSPRSILEGYEEGSMPKEYVGGLGEEGVANLKKFVENGGTLVFLNRSSDFAIEQFKLPIKDVTDGLEQKEFFIPGSILRTELDTTHPIAKGMEKESIAWFGRSPAFEVLDGSRVKVIAKYPDDPKKILLSGWAFGTEKLAGRAALVEVSLGKGKIILFGFRPQYRGQSLATFPLLFNAIRR